MALNLARVGHSYPAYAYEVGREKVKEYVAATGGDPSPYVLSAGGDASDPAALVAPPTFAACFTIAQLDVLLDDPELDAHPNLVHNSQSFQLHSPIRIGETLVCTPTVADITDRGRMELLTLAIDCVDQGGDLVVTSSSTIIFFTQEGA